MTKVFVHGNPETTAVWEPLLPALAKRGVTDIKLLSPPGFGGAVPSGYSGTRLAHRDWLIGEIEKIGHPVDLLGHDWGAAGRQHWWMWEDPEGAAEGLVKFWNGV